MNVSPTKIAAQAKKMVLARRGLGSQQRRQGGSGNDVVYGKKSNTTTRRYHVQKAQLGLIWTTQACNDPESTMANIAN